MGRVTRRALERMAASPDGVAGFRRLDAPKSAIKHGWMKLAADGYMGRLARVDYYEITPEGREALTAVLAKQPGWQG